MPTPGLQNALLNDPEHRCQRAEEARAIADGIADPEAKRTRLGIAEGYERLASDKDPPTPAPSAPTRPTRGKVTSSAPAAPAP